MSTPTMARAGESHFGPKRPRIQNSSWSACAPSRQPTNPTTGLVTPLSFNVHAHKTHDLKLQRNLSFPVRHWRFFSTNLSGNNVQSGPRSGYLLTLRWSTLYPYCFCLVVVVDTVWIAAATFVKAGKEHIQPTAQIRVSTTSTTSSFPAHGVPKAKEEVTLGICLVFLDKLIQQSPESTCFPCLFQVTTILLSRPPPRLSVGSNFKGFRWLKVGLASGRAIVQCV